MTEGVVFMGEKPIGTFVLYPYPSEDIDIAWSAGLRAAETLEYARQNDIPIRLVKGGEL